MCYNKNMQISHKVIYISLFCLIFLAVILFVIFVFNKTGNNSTNEILNPKKENWKTYNSSSNFSFSYPKNLTYIPVNTTLQENIIANFQLRSPDYRLSVPNERSTDSSSQVLSGEELTVSVRRYEEIPDLKAFQEIIDKQGGPAELEFAPSAGVIKKEIILGGQKGLLYSANTTGTATGISGHISVAYTVHKGKIYYFVFIGRNNKGKELEDILSSFKFKN